MAKQRQRQDLNPQKLKLFYIADYLMTETDPDEDIDGPHGKFVSDIKDYLAEQGIIAEEHSISRDIRLLKEYFGMDINKSVNRTPILR